MQITNTKPEWGTNLLPGFCGFITREHDLIGDGIEFFERYDGGLPFVHTFMVTGPDLVIEAHAKTGVGYAPLHQYLGDADCQCFIRVPAGYTPDIGARLVGAAEKHIGEKYAYSLIVAEALANTWYGHLLNKWTGNVPDNLVSWVLAGAHQKICSGLVSTALQSEMYLRLRGCLRRPYFTINPKELGNDDSVFHPLVYKFM